MIQAFFRWYSSSTCLSRFGCKGKKRSVTIQTRVFNPGSTFGDTIKQKGDFGPEIVRHKHDAVSAGLANYATETYDTDSQPNLTGIPGTDLLSGGTYLLSSHNIPGQ